MIINGKIEYEWGQGLYKGRNWESKYMRKGEGRGKGRESRKGRERCRRTNIFPSVQ